MRIQKVSFAILSHKKLRMKFHTFQAYVKKVTHAVTSRSSSKENVRQSVRVAGKSAEGYSNIIIYYLQRLSLETQLDSFKSNLQ